MLGNGKKLKLSMRREMEIYQLLPNSEKYSIAIDERGVILEGPVDPQCHLELKDICLIYYATDKMIDAFLEDKFEKEKKNLEKGENKERDNTQAIILLGELQVAVDKSFSVYPNQEIAIAVRKARNFLYPFNFGEDE